MKIEYYKTIEALQRWQGEARAKLHELKTAGYEAWEDVKGKYSLVKTHRLKQPLICVKKTED